MSVQKITTDEAKKIFIRYMSDLPKEVQVALKFTLAHWEIFKSIEDINNLESKITATEAKFFLRACLTYQQMTIILIRSLLID